jgi:hypothetical protein
MIAEYKHRRTCGTITAVAGAAPCDDVDSLLPLVPDVAGVPLLLTLLVCVVTDAVAGNNSI